MPINAETEVHLWMNDANDCCLATREGTAEKISEFGLVV